MSLNKYSFFITSDYGVLLCTNRKLFPKIEWPPFTLNLPKGLPEVIYTNQDWCVETKKCWHCIDGQKIAPVDELNHPIELIGLIINALKQQTNNEQARQPKEAGGHTGHGD